MTSPFFHRPFQPSSRQRFWACFPSLIAILIASGISWTLGYWAVLLGGVWAVYLNHGISSNLAKRTLAVAIAPFAMIMVFMLHMVLYPLPWKYDAFHVLFLASFLVLSRMGTGPFRILRNHALSSVIVIAYLAGSIAVWHYVGGHPGLTERLLYPALKAKPPVAWSSEEQRAAIDILYEELHSSKANAATLSRLKTKLPEAAHNNHLSVSVYTNSPFEEHRVIVQEESPYESLVHAADRLKGKLGEADLESLSIKVDIIGSLEKIPYRPVLQIVGSSILAHLAYFYGLQNMGWLTQLSFELEPGIDGLLAEKTDETQVMLPTDPIYKGWLSPRAVSKQRKWKQVLKELKLMKPESLQLFKFQTFSFVQTRQSRSPISLVRGRPSVGTVDLKALQQNILAGSHWLSDQVLADGSFRYEYFPAKDYSPHTYNIVRHAGTVYSLFRIATWALSEGLDKEADAYLKAAKRSMNWLSSRVLPPAGLGDPYTVCLNEPGGVSSGGSALTLMAYLYNPDLTEYPIHPVQMNGLQKCLIQMIDSKGAVFRSMKQSLSLEEVEKEPVYYPGEVLLALALHYQKTKNEASLEAATRIADYRLIRYQEEKRWDHWIVQGLSLMAQLTKKQAYADAALDMGEQLLRTQVRKGYVYFSDELGSFMRLFDVPRTTRAGSRMEALADLWRLSGNSKEQEIKFREALRVTARHLLEQQLTSQNTFFLPDPLKSIGCIPMGIVDLHCRIDNNQHALIGLIGAYDALKPYHEAYSQK